MGVYSTNNVCLSMIGVRQKRFLTPFLRGVLRTLTPPQRRPGDAAERPGDGVGRPAPARGRREAQSSRASTRRSVIGRARLPRQPDRSQIMRFVPPNKRDITDLSVATASFDEAFGSVDPFGRYEPSRDGVSLWMMVEIDKETMATLWHDIGIDTGAESSYRSMLAGHGHKLYVKALKAKHGFFGKERWVGNVCFLFDRMQLPVGSVGGHTQSEMWQHFRKFINLEQRLFQGTIAALEGNEGDTPRAD
jgi:hypothetical protein